MASVPATARVLLPGPAAAFVDDDDREKAWRCVRVVVSANGNRADGRVTKPTVVDPGGSSRDELASARGAVDDGHRRRRAVGRAGGRDDVLAAVTLLASSRCSARAELRVEHEDHANTHGRVVGAKHGRCRQPYDHLPFFYSDLFDFGYEAVGDLDARRRRSRVGGANRKGVVAVRGRRGAAAWIPALGGLRQGRRSRDLIRAGEPIDEAALGGLALTSARSSSGRRRARGRGR